VKSVTSQEESSWTIIKCSLEHIREITQVVANVPKRVTLSNETINAMGSILTEIATQLQNVFPLLNPNVHMKISDPALEIIQKYVNVTFLVYVTSYSKRSFFFFLFSKTFKIVASFHKNFLFLLCRREIEEKTKQLEMNPIHHTKHLPILISQSVNEFYKILHLNCFFCVLILFE
jgi:hypothetical protein